MILNTWHVQRVILLMLSLRQGATGFWQIMEGTGREFGMTINKEVDERYCIEKSTRFACAFFRKAYEKYGKLDHGCSSIQ